MKETSIRKRKGFEGQQLIVIPRKIVKDFLVKDPVTRQVHITDIGYYPKAAFHYAERPAGISQEIIIYCLEGYGWVEIGGKRIELSPSEFIAIPANRPHKYGADRNKPWTIYWVHFKGEIAPYIIKLILENSRDFKPRLSFNENRIKLFNDIYANLERGYSADTLRYVNMTFSHFLSSLIYEEKFNYLENDKGNDVVKRAVNKMQNNIDTSLRLNELSAAVHLSTSRFAEIFRLKTGYSAIEYFNHLKMQKACQLLSFTDKTVKEIAYSLGIEDPYYFSRMFTRLMGVSPTAYRNKRI